MLVQVPYQPRPQQREFSRRFRKARFGVLVCHRRFGKSVLGVNLLQQGATMSPKERPRYAFIGPTFRQGKAVAWDYMRYYAKDIPGARVNHSELRIDFAHNGGQVRIYGTDNPDCFDERTEILTKSGWVAFPALPRGEAVMTLNPATNVAEWQVPIRYVEQRYRGEMFALRSKKLDLLVTPTHRFLVDTRKGVRKFKTIDRVSAQDRIPASVGWDGTNPEGYTADDMAFLGFYLAEGCARKDPGPKCSYEITFAQTPGPKGGQKGDVRQQFCEVLDRLGVSYRHHPDCLRVYGRKMWERVVSLGVAWDKRIPREILDLPPALLRVLLHWMVLGDGTTRRNGERMYYTTSKGLADDVQELCMRIGQSAAVAGKAQAVSQLADGRAICAKRPLYQVKIYRNTFTYFRDTGGSYVSREGGFDGMVYCVEVPNQAIYVRRNGKAAWSGNSLRGIYLDGCVLDEFGMHPAKTYSEVIAPLLVDRGGWALFDGTPNGRNQFYDMAQYAKAQEADGNATWVYGEYRASQTGLLDPAFLADARATMTEDEYQQEFECNFSVSVRGAIYAKEMALAQDEGRITNVPYDALLPVHTAWDLGVGDHTAIWFWQALRGGEVRLVDYYEASGEGLPHYVGVLQRKPYVYGRHWAPPDIRVRELGSGKSRLETAASLGLKFEVVRDIGLEDGISAARMLLPRCWFDQTKARAGIDALQSYRRDYSQKLDEFKSSPVHDHASHGADAFRYLCVAHQPPVDAKKTQHPFGGHLPPRDGAWMS